MTKKLSLDELLEIWDVLPPGMWDNEDGPEDWYAVTALKEFNLFILCAS